MAEYRPKPRDEIARNMSAIRSTDNKTERALRSELHRRGFRFRKYGAALPGRPDIVFARAKIAVFVDGDYWHSRVLQERGEAALAATIKNSNRDYWLNKFKRNVARDVAATAALKAAGWKVIRIWESDAKKDIKRVADRVGRLLSHRTGLARRD